MPTIIRSAVDFVKGLVLFWVLLLLVALAVTGSQQTERAPVAEQRAREARRLEERQSQAYEESQRQAGAH
jgi:hypothetical protein